jgi:hypothetical protein
MAKANSLFGDYYVAQSISDSAFLYYKAEKIYNDLNDSVLNLGKTVFFNRASLLYKVGDFLGGERSINET